MLTSFGDVVIISTWNIKMKQEQHPKFHMNARAQGKSPFGLGRFSVLEL